MVWWLRSFLCYSSDILEPLNLKLKWDQNSKSIWVRLILTVVASWFLWSYFSRRTDQTYKFYVLKSMSSDQHSMVTWTRKDPLYIAGELYCIVLNLIINIYSELILVPCLMVPCLMELENFFADWKCYNCILRWREETLCRSLHMCISIYKIMLHYNDFPQFYKNLIDLLQYKNIKCPPLTFDGCKCSLTVVWFAFMRLIECKVFHEIPILLALIRVK